jgi:type II secretory pathway pseudopilin PulG
MRTPPTGRRDSSGTKMMTTMMRSHKQTESGMTLLAVMAFMTILAIGLLAMAPSIHTEVQREKELESIRRGEEIADAIRQYIIHHRGAKLPQSIDDLLEGLPYGTKKLQILRPSAATDPLSEDGKWRLIPAEPEIIAAFAKRVQAFNNGLLPSSPQPVNYFNKYTVGLANVLNTGTEDEVEDDEDYSAATDNTPFIGVASQSRSKSVITYYGIENHSKWIFTPLFRGSGASIIRGTGTFGAPPAPPPPPRSGF